MKHLVRKHALDFVIVLTLFAIVAFGLFSGCAPTGTGINNRTWEQTATDAYQATGLVLSTSKATLDALAASGTVAPDKAAQCEEIYKIAYDAYIACGDLLATAIETTDTAERENAIAAYQAALAKLPGLVAQVTKVVAEVENR